MLRSNRQTKMNAKMVCITLQRSTDLFSENSGGFFGWRERENDFLMNFCLSVKSALLKCKEIKP